MQGDLPGLLFKHLPSLVCDLLVRARVGGHAEFLFAGGETCFVILVSKG